MRGAGGAAVRAAGGRVVFGGGQEAGDGVVDLAGAQHLLSGGDVGRAGSGGAVGRLRGNDSAEGGGGSGRKQGGGTSGRTVHGGSFS
ncbi:hypothetical protein GCM10020000_07410 [Streptomyces olivoverticillatus]